MKFLGKARIDISAVIEAKSEDGAKEIMAGIVKETSHKIESPVFPATCNGISAESHTWDVDAELLPGI